MAPRSGIRGFRENNRNPSPDRQGGVDPTDEDDEHEEEYDYSKARAVPGGQVQRSHTGGRPRCQSVTFW